MPEHVVVSDLVALATDAELTAHVEDVTDAHDASAISFTPTGTVASTNVQAAIAEVASEGGAGAHPDLAAHDTLGLATQAELDAVASAKANTSHSHVDADLPAGIARDSEVTSAISTHAGLADPHTVYRLESVPIAAADVAADVATQAELDAHIADTTSIHGIADTSALVLTTDARFTTLTANRQTGTSYTLVLSDAAKVIESDNAAANTVTIPANASVPFPVGTVLAGLQYGAGQTTIVADGGVTLRAPDGLVVGEQYGAWSGRKIDTDEWEVQVAAAAAGGGDLLAANNLSDVASASTSLTNLGGVAKALYDANTVLIATTDNTPVALAMGASTILARLASGDIIAATPAQLRTLLGLVVGTDVQAQDAELAAIAGLASAADRLAYFTGSGSASLATFTSFARTLLDDADAAAALATLGAVPTAQSVNAQTGTTYTLVAADAGKLVSLSNAGAITLTVPQDSDATIAVGTYVDLYALGAGQVTVVAGAGATLRTSGLTAKSRAQYARFGVQKVSANTWSLFGDLAAS